MSNKPTETLGRFGSHWYFYAARHHLGSIGENIGASKRAGLIEIILLLCTFWKPVFRNVPNCDSWIRIGPEICVSDTQVTKTYRGNKENAG